MFSTLMDINLSHTISFTPIQPKYPFFSLFLHIYHWMGKRAFQPQLRKVKVLGNENSTLIKTLTREIEIFRRTQLMCLILLYIKVSCGFEKENTCLFSSHVCLFVFIKNSFNSFFLAPMKYQIDGIRLKITTIKPIRGIQRRHSSDIF